MSEHGECPVENWKGQRICRNQTPEQGPSQGIEREKHNGGKRSRVNGGHRNHTCIDQEAWSGKHTSGKINGETMNNPKKKKKIEAQIRP